MIRGVECHSWWNNVFCPLDCECWPNDAVERDTDANYVVWRGQNTASTRARKIDARADWPGTGTAGCYTARGPFGGTAAVITS